VDGAVSRRRLPLLLLLVIAALLAAPGSASAHPLGNFTTNTYAGLTVGTDRVDIDYVVDLAEIPALRIVQDLDQDGDNAVSQSEGAGYEREECDRLADGITIQSDDREVEVAARSAALTFPAGQAGLVTLRLECALEAATGESEGDRRLEFADANLDGRIGWREVTASGDGTTLVESDVPTTTLSDRLLSYPADRIAAPLNVRSATVVARPGGGSDGGAPEGAGGIVGGPVGRGLERLATRFTDLVAEQRLTPAFTLLALGVAIVLGGLHALAPGHGKTVMAAVLVSRDGTVRQALALGVTVAVTHTLGVLILGAILSVTEVVAPERLYGWLGIASGLLFATVGLTLLRAALRRRTKRSHDHEHSHGHEHGHEHGPDGHSHALGWRSLVAPGLAGGLLPSPSALVVLLGGIALDRTWFGIVLVAAYGIGMAGVLVGAGWLLLRARKRFSRPSGEARLGRIFAVLPVATALLVVVAGLVIAARSAVTVL
jgi:ABC-type nickel/cobalt efflux system permease component RcnA